MLGKKSIVFSLLFFGFIIVVLLGCEKKNKELIVYAGQGLKNVMEEIIHDFENKYQQKVKVIYAGSGTLLQAITKSKIGDIFIPGSDKFIEKAGDLVLRHRKVALHAPAIVVHQGNPKNIKSFEDLLKPGVKIAIGNKDMCAIGRISEEIIQAFPQKNELAKNITITASTVNELLDLVLYKEADAAFVWNDMKLWPNANNLGFLEIPPSINKTEKIQIAILSTTTDEKKATDFADFVATEGKQLFTKHGFGENK